MNEYQKKLFERLLEKNDQLSVNQAQTWIELLWEDFEATYAKAGKEYKGNEMTAKVVSQWVENHGEKLHEFIASNPKYKHLLEQNDKKLH
ncbi:YfhJ family protein [Cytobacillus purgationiresistens]|uniref:Succinate dehydrogenase flavin-adding protein (Antitoxin of CptAB toxin-antitoxin module) n=1 Tax=Cytobacillus purgationiresistens TaxID=863449 RepID=A0ABU0AQR2_9BACI|nr:YfhJ family protein [Cytobacillus purgationiresistens]MDQ0273613.1 succinate dehydrogenase flavin-adding protein (antitoxin of CptAB toxin-antitoxin module) [Cytobacillus purgationiresistens]